ncbi:acyltransferase|uniref:acyltransferase family protein n=1 Tax=Noviherbaspirillum sp. L7-7A TaxID=2850560 RepID=UPI001C2BCF55|nr:acyltransferase [Noviherbaspirillum sp. L7-7A]MBV0881135.1 acyltransferase [Noviherbaspirillum sp. L7-7A]
MKNVVPRQPRLLEGVQYLRGIAAMMVVFHHARHEFGGAMSVTFGGRGVEIFFVISGLVMMYSTQGGQLAAGRSFTEKMAEAMLFWKRRIARVVPLYWIALFLSATLAYRTALTDPVLLQDALFMPHWNRVHPDQIWPTLVPGWSLNYEMFFYFLFGLSLLLGRFSIAFMSAALLGLCLLNVVAEGQSAAFQFYTAPVMLHFLAGVMLYYLVEYLRQKAAWQPSRWSMLLLLLMGFAALALLPQHMGDAALLLSSSVIVFSAVFLFDGIRLPLLRLLGDASYAIYLFHVLALLMVTEVLASAGLAAVTPWQVLAHFAVYLTVSGVIGVLVHLAVEKPMTAHALSFIRRAQPMVSAARR